MDRLVSSPLLDSYWLWGIQGWEVATALLSCCGLDPATSLAVAVPMGREGTSLPKLWQEQLRGGLLKMSFKIRSALEFKEGSDGSRPSQEAEP